MRIIVFFDLPMESAKEKKDYQHFRKQLVKNGFLRMQNSVYSKIVVNSSSMLCVKALVKTILPTSGNVQMLCITEKQFASIEYLVGEKISDVEDSPQRVVEL